MLYIQFAMGIVMKVSLTVDSQPLIRVLARWQPHSLSQIATAERGINVLAKLLTLQESAQAHSIGGRRERGEAKRALIEREKSAWGITRTATTLARQEK